MSSWVAKLERLCRPGERIVRREVLQVLLVAAAMRDVLHLHEEAPRVVGLVADHRRLDRHPDRRPGGVHEARLDLVLVAVADDELHDRLAVIAVLLGMHEGLELRAGQLTDALPREVAERAVDPDHAAAVVGQRHADRRALERAPEQRLGGRQLRHRALALGDVADRRRHEQALVGLERAEADLDRELAAVLVAAEELQARAHGAGRRVAQIALHVMAVMAAEASRDQLGDAEADDLLALIAEQPLGLRVDERDVTVPVDDHHRVRRGLQQRAELALRAAEQAVAAHDPAREAVVRGAHVVDDPAQDLAEGDH